MNFVKTTIAAKQTLPRVINENDLVVIYERHDSMDHVYIQSGRTYDNKYGAFKHDDFLGKPFGSKVFSRTSSGWVYALEPSPDLWTLAVRTRTQIVDSLDSSVITLSLDLFPGCIAIESGTGSGCMSLSLARAVAPNGHVYTYEYNANRAEQATEEFKKLGVDGLVTVTCQDVCGKIGDGGFIGVTDHTADAVFLDLPEPWLAIRHAVKALKPGRNICCYSPCAEQVMKTVETLRAFGFHTIRMVEAKHRQFDGRIVDLEVPDLGLNPLSETVTEPVINDSDQQLNGNTKRQKVEVEENELEVRGGIEDGVEVEVEVGGGEKMAVAESDDGSDKSDHEADPELSAHPNDKGEMQTQTMSASGERQEPVSSVQPPLHLRRKRHTLADEPALSTRRTAVARAASSMKGHTAFLTFAIAPSIVSSERILRGSQQSNSDSGTGANSGGSNVINGTTNTSDSNQ